MIVRRDQFETATDSDERARLNLLLSHAEWRDAPIIEQLERLLRPLGIHTVTAESGDEAADIIQRILIHIAVVDWSIPLEGSSRSARPGGGRILQLLRRLDRPPPTVIVRPPQPVARESTRGLSEALREGAFAVVDSPVRLETMLEIMRRVVRRHYRDNWPDQPATD